MQSSFASFDNFICEISQLGIISVTGDEAVSYLQGKITIDVEKLEAGRGQIGCHCDFKGKMWSIFYALRNGPNVQLVCHKESLTGSLNELKKYGVFSKVEFADSSEQTRVFGTSGEIAEQVIVEQFGSLPGMDMERVSNSQGTVLRFNHPHPRYLILASQSLAKQIEQQLNRPLDDERIWEALDIQAGIPNIQAATANEFIPQMVNIQALDGISFDKGCYMGQEVVARTKYLGKNKRAAFVLKSDQQCECKAGDTLEMQMGENWRRGGTVLRSVSDKDQTWLLAVLPNDTGEQQKFRLKNEPECLFSLGSLPYALA